MRATPFLACLSFFPANVPALTVTLRRERRDENVLRHSIIVYSFGQKIQTNILFFLFLFSS